MLPKQWLERRGCGRIAEFYPTNVKGTLHVYSSNGESRYALRFFVADCRDFVPKIGDEVSFTFRTFRALEIRRLDKEPCAVVTLDLGGSQ